MARHNQQDNLTILQWNARSLVNKRDELILLIDEHNPHIICICETWLTADRSFAIPGYKISRKDRDGAGGGVLIGVKEYLAASAIRVDPT